MVSKSQECMLDSRQISLGGLSCMCQRLMVLKKSHNSKTAGHFGFVKTLHLVKKQFLWPSLKKTLKAMWPVALSATQLGEQQGENPGLLQTVTETSVPWRDISMDFIVELPESSGNRVIWVITNLFSKQVHFVHVKRSHQHGYQSSCFCTSINYMMHPNA